MLFLKKVQVLQKQHNLALYCDQKTGDIICFVLELFKLTVEYWSPIAAPGISDQND